MKDGTYYYGQGKVYLALRDSSGKHGSWRWVGDVSSLNVNFEFTQKIVKSSRKGMVYQTQAHMTECAATVTSVWHDFSKENLAILLNSEPLVEPFSIHSTYELSAGIVEGDNFSLPHTNVFNVTIIGLTDGTDYQVDPLWGMIEFIKTPDNKKYTVNYEHLQNLSLPLFSSSSIELSLRYQGVNIAEGNSPLLVELYRLVFDPLTTLELINAEDAVLGMVTTAKLLADMTSNNESTFSHFGKIQILKPQPTLTYNGEAIHNGRHKYRGF